MEMDAAIPTLPRAGDLSPQLTRFLAGEFRTLEDLSRSVDLEAELRRRCSDLEASIDDRGRRLSDAIAAYSSHSNEVRSVLSGVAAGLSELRSSASSFRLGEDGREEAGRSDRILEEELLALAREVGRVETVRAYAETALKLDRLVGDVEDVVSSIAGKRVTTITVDSELTAYDSIEQIEETLNSITKSRPEWTRLVSSVDHRIDRALAVLRPQAIADHRNLLVSLGWPPPLSGPNASTSATANLAGFVNPFFTMSAGLKTNYCKSFLSLCKLQELQRRRKYRQLMGHNVTIMVHEPLWVIEEVVVPIALVSQRYFSKWNEKPELIFTLVYKVTRDFVDSMDDILQPLVDKARLVGYSCREEWISSMVTSLTTYLAKEVFPKYIEQLQEIDLEEVQSQARASWLHLVDLMMTFDKRVQSLITNSGLSLSLRDDENLRKTSFLSVFCDRPDWLDIWADIELKDVLTKLKTSMEDEKNWKTTTPRETLISSSEDHKSPVVSLAVQKCLSIIVERSHLIPDVTLRARFLRLTGAPIVREFLHCLLHRCQEAEGLTALADDEALIKVSNSINAARFLESILAEWCEDVFFLEMGSINDDNTTAVSGIFEGEINELKEFGTEWCNKITVVVLRDFDARCRDYLKNKKQWQQKAEEWSVSKTFVAALDHLQRKISKLQEELNEVDFVALWRGLAGGIDLLVFSNILTSGTKVSSCGAERFGGDMKILFGVFAAWCLRPDGFFPRLSEGLRLLNMEEAQLRELVKGKESLRWDPVLRHLTAAEAERIARNRVFTDEN